MAVTLKTMAKIIVGGIFGGPAGAGKAAAQGVFDWMITRFNNDERSHIEKAIDNVENELKTFEEAIPNHEGLPADLSTVVMGNVKALFETCPLSAEEIVELHYNPDKAAKMLMERETSHLEEPYKNFCHSLTKKIYHTILKGDGIKNIEGMQLAFNRAVLEKLETLNRLPSKIAAAVEDFAAQALIESDYIPWRKDRLHFTALLSAHYRVVPFHRLRNKQCRDLIEWFESDGSIKIKLIAGDGGLGKTRLCAEAAKKLRLKGYRAGFLKEDGSHIPGTVINRMISNSRPLFLVIDYAENRTKLVSKILKRLAGLDDNKKVRLVLIARNKGDWWEELKRQGGGAGDILQSLCTSEMFITELNVQPEDRFVVFEQAAKAFSEELDLHSADITAPDLDEPHFGKMLFLHLSALAALYGERPKTEDELLDFVLDREQRKWDEKLDRADMMQFSGMPIANAVALLTLIKGARSREHARTILNRPPYFQGIDNLSLCNLYDHTISYFFPIKGQVGRMTPDLLGERHIERVVEKDPSFLDVINRLDDENLSHPLTVLTRIAKRNPERTKWLENVLGSDFERLAEVAMSVAEETGPPMDEALSNVLKRVNDPEIALRLAEKIPERTLYLRRPAVAAWEIYIDHLRIHPRGGEFNYLGELAGSLNNLSIHLAGLDRREEALVKNKESAKIYQNIVGSNHNEFLPSLVASLNNLSNRYSDVGQWNKALDVINTVVDKCRSLANSNKDNFLPDLAMSLSTQARCLLELGCLDKSLKSIEEGAEIYRQPLKIPHSAMVFGFFVEYIFKKTSVRFRVFELVPGWE